MPLDLSFPCFLSMRSLLTVIHFFIHFVRLFPTIFCSNNRRRLWRPMMNELRKRHGLAKRDPLPCEVLDTFPDAPRHPYDDISSIYCPSQVPEDRPRPPLQIGSQSELFQAPEVTPLSVAPAVATAALQPQDHEDAISSAADSVAAAAMMLMTGGRESSPAKNAMNGVECIDSVDQGGNSNEPKELSQRVVTSPVIEAKASKLSTSWQVRSFPLWNAENSPPKEQVKFNLGGTVVQVPTEILLKHEGSKIAAITRSAMRVGDMAIPLPRDYEMFCTNDDYTTRKVVERSCLRPNNDNERNQSLLDKLTHHRKLLAFVRQSRVAAEVRIHNILHEESNSLSLIIPRGEVVGFESSTLLDEADPGSNDGTYSTQVHANEPDLESHTRLTWDDGLEQLKAIKVKFGHVDVIMTNTDQKNQPLRNFVKSIHESYKNILEGQTSGNKLLSNQRISELERMGFKFQMLVRTSWEHRFEELRQHFRTHGNLEVPKNSVLRGWVHQQRYHFRMILKGATNSLTEKRIGLLNSIGFDWRVVMKVQVPDQVSVNADQGR